MARQRKNVSKKQASKEPKAKAASSTPSDVPQHQDGTGSKEIVIQTIDIEPIIQYTLYALLFSRILVQPFYSLISDCDETFNYWEPLNYMVRGFGKETWEYSPVYSIRSWCFLLPLFNVLKVVSKLAKLVPAPLSSLYKPYHLFYLARVLLGAASFLVERQFFIQLCVSFSADFAKWWLLLQLFNPGYFHASVELLPSSFAMIIMLHATNYYLKYVSERYQNRTKLDFFVKSVACIVVAAIAGWPFVFVLILPLGLHFVLNNFNYTNFIAKGLIGCAKSLFVIVAYITFVDSIFYGKFSPVFFNIVAYNVFNATEESGPNIFGVEPWYYYLQNLVLNFPLVTLLGLLLSFTIFYRFQFFKKCWPVYLQIVIWIGIFNNQPHKEERFLYPIYGLLTFVAAASFVSLSSGTNASSKNKSKKSQSLPKQKKLGCIVKMLLVFALAGQALLRISSLVINYTGPLSVYEHLNKLPQNTDSESIVNVCVGREWYHYPSSFFLPDNYRLKFVSSGFDGLLPGDFQEDVETWVSGIRIVPEGMNNMNLYDEGKVVGIQECDYLIDVDLSSYDTGKDAINDSTKGQQLYCSSIIDVEHSKLLGRAFTMPFWSYLPEPILKLTSKFYQVEYLDYCLYENGVNKV
ncbi:hypothetical protein ACO0QE_000951 [Hanseniaspora vineae]